MSTIPLPPIRSVEALRQYLDAGAAPKYLFFWGHTAQPGRPVGREVFSQWYPAPFALDGISYATTEQYMMAEKARFFGDEATRAAILASTHPNTGEKVGSPSAELR
ncbi:NADAR domain-containing protein [Hymenobacter sp. AT01-02]|uniref:NADAR domain-containing protein n=1 Tax=Hymenobacter sp. AT01-02 TaxID=1571877 RepID=UPI000AD5699E